MCGEGEKVGGGEGGAHGVTQEVGKRELKLEGLKSLRLRLNSGELVILPTDKSGKIAVMTIKTYIIVGDVHRKGDKEITITFSKRSIFEVVMIFYILFNIFLCFPNKHFQKRWQFDQSYFVYLHLFF